MARTNNLTNFLTDVADSIREKTGKSDPIACEDFDTEIESIETGGGDTPTIGYVVNEFDSNGKIKSVTTYGYTNLPDYQFYNQQELTTITLNSGLKKFGYNCFYNCTKLSLTSLPNTVTTFTEYCFYNCQSLSIKSLPDSVTAISQRAFPNCTGLTQLSMNVTGIAGTATGNPAFYGCTNIVAFWLGSKFNNSGVTYSGNYGLYIGGNKKLQRIFIDRPRSEVEALSGYNYAFQGDTSQTAKDRIICNDDEGFMTREQFDAIDWEHYSF